MGKKGAPAAPDYSALAREQGAANIDAARVSGRYSNPDIYSPYGQREVTYGSQIDPNQFNAGAYQEAMRKYQDDYEAWRLDPAGRPRAIGTDNMPVAPNRQTFMGGFDPDQVIIRETLTPEAQAQFDQQMRINTQFGNVAEGGLGRVARSMGGDFDASILPSVKDPVTGVFNPVVNFQARSNLPDLQADELTRDRVEQALFSRLNPQLERARQQREEQLILQGQGRGGRAWQSTQEDLIRGESDALLSAILGAGQEQQRLFDMQRAARGQLFGEDLSTYQQNASTAQLNQNAQQALYGLQSQNRNRALQEALALRQLPLTEINALRTGSQPIVPQFQGFQGVNVAPAQPFQAGQMNYEAQLDAVNAKNAQRGQTFGSLASLAGAGIGAAGAAGGFGNLFGIGAGAGAGASGANYFAGIRP